jgi:hypothetical protein
MANRVVHADAVEEQHAASVASSGNTIFLVLKYLGTFAEILSGILAGHLDQTIRGIKLGGKKYKIEIIASEDTGA